MTRELAVLITLVGYKIVLIMIGLWANRRTRDTADFFLGGRSLGPWVAAISASASSSSAWSLLGVSGAAYVWGLSAIWLFPSVFLGFLFNWLWLAPRIRVAAERQGAVTVTDMLIGSNNPLARRTAIFCSLIVIFSFSFYVASQFQAAGDTFSVTFGMGLRSSILTGTIIILIYTLLGGFWAVSVTDTLQGLLMAASALALPTVALIEVGGFSGLISGMKALEQGTWLQLTGPHVGITAIGFVAGCLGIGLGYPGQPHVVNRLMALKDDRAVRQGRVIALGWSAVVFGGMLLAGWCGRVLFPQLGNSEQVLFTLTMDLFPPVISGVITAAILSAIMSTADSQLLVAASSLSYDLKHGGDARQEMLYSRLAVVAICVVSALLAMFAPEAIFTRVLFAWTALGSAFGPILIVRMAGYNIKPGFVLGALMAGFFLTIFFNRLPDPPPGRYLERMIPFTIAMIIAWSGRLKKQPS